MFAVLPKPSAVADIQANKKKIEDAEFKIALMRKTTEAANLIAQGQTWAGGGDEIGPTAYAAINKLATDRQVKILNFRPQRAINAGDLTQLPYVINVTGDYENVLSLVNAIETTPTKLAVELLQLGSSDESTSTVTGTIGLEAYVLNAVTTTQSSSTSTKTVPSTSEAGTPIKTSALDKPSPASKSERRTEISATVKTTKETKTSAR